MIKDMIETVREEMRYNQIIKTVVYSFVVIIVVVLALVASFILTPLFEPTYVYIGQVKKVEVQKDIIKIKLDSLISRPKENILRKKYEEPWTHVFDPGILNNKKMVTSFSKNFKLKNKDQINIEIGDIVKVYAKGSKIKTIEESDFRDEQNAVTQIIIGELVAYKNVIKNIYDSESKHYELEFKTKQVQVKDGKIQLKLIISEEEFKSLNLKVGMNYEVVKNFDFDTFRYEEWVFTEIDKY